MGPISIEAGHVGEQFGPRLARRGQGPEDDDTVVVDGVGMSEHDVAQGVRDVRETCTPGRHELLDEERVASAAAMDLGDEIARRECWVERLDQQAGLPSIQRADPDPFAIGLTFELGQQRTQWVAPVQLVVAKRADQQERSSRTDASRRCHHHPRGRIRPVEVLDNDEQRPSPSHPVEHTDHESHIRSLDIAAASLRTSPSSGNSRANAAWAGPSTRSTASSSRPSSRPAIRSCTGASV